MGRRKYGLNKKEVNKALKKYGPTGTLGVFLILIAIDIFGFSFMCSSVNYGSKSSSNIGAIIISIFVLGLGVFLLIKGKQEIRQEQQRLIEEEKHRKKEEIKTYYNRLSVLSLSNIENTDKMTGNEFEDFLQSLFLLLGYKVNKTKLSGDFGADLILEKDEKIIVQAKRYNKKVSLSAIQEITAAKKHYSINNAWVITNNYFTKPANDLAVENNIRLIDREELAKLILKSKNIDKNKNIFENKIKQELQKIDNNEPINIPKQITNCTNPIMDKTQFYKNNNDYDLFFSNKVFKTKDKLILAYTNSDINTINLLIKEIEALEIKTEQNKISLHFFYQETAEILYSMRYISENLIVECIKYCDKDINLLKNTKIDTPITITTLTRKAIILEKQNKLKEAIAICDFAILNNFYDKGKPFNIRKAKLEKKLGDKENGY